MTWERDPLWAKSRLFFERAFREQDDPPVFGLWCSLGLEALARAAVASVSPTLLAAPDKGQKNLLFALNKGTGPARSLGMFEVIELCQHLFKEHGFTQEDGVSARLLLNLRNEELHSGTAAFEVVQPHTWLPGFYRACKKLCNAMGESLASLLDEERADVAEKILTRVENAVISKVKAAIAASKRNFEAKLPDEQADLIRSADAATARLAFHHHHRVKCPACNSSATVEGDSFGPERVEHQEDGIVVRRSVAPDRFNCPACGLSLVGYAELSVADLGGFYTRTSFFTPEEFYDFDPEAIVEEYIRSTAYEEYDNE